ncbi:MAG: ATP-binding cassette domain-containing protein [Anaerolineales bacterium]
MLEVKQASKRYGDIVALDSASFVVGQGQIVGLLGHNGAGKSTAIKIITGYLQPDSGTVTVNGLDVTTDTRRVQAMIGYLPESAPLYPELSVQAYLVTLARLRGVPESALLARLSEAVYATGLQDHLTRPIGQLSKGFRQRVGLAQAIIHQPELLILDEPSIGLDPTQIIEMRALIRRLAEHSTVLFSTHILSEVEALCDRVVILVNGRVRADAALSELATAPTVSLVLARVVDGVPATLRAEAGVTEVTTHRHDDGSVTYTARAGDAPQDAAELSERLFRCAAAHQWPVREIKRDVRSLESVFSALAVERPVQEVPA